MPAEAIYVEDSLGFTALARSMKVTTPSNACANILLQRVVELAGLPYKPAALTTVAQISAHIEALNDPEKAAAHMHPNHSGAHSSDSPFILDSGSKDKYLPVSPIPPSMQNRAGPSTAEDQRKAESETAGARHESQRASAFPPNLPGPGEWSPLTRHDEKIETNVLLQKFIDFGDAEGGQFKIKSAYERLMACLPFVQLNESLLYSEAEQDLLAPHLTSSVMEAACNGRNFDMVLELVTLMPRLKDCIVSDVESRIDVDHAVNTSHRRRQTTLLCWAIRHRNLQIVARLMQLGVDVNAPEPGSHQCSKQEEGFLSLLPPCRLSILSCEYCYEFFEYF